MNITEALLDITTPLDNHENLILDEAEIKSLQSFDTFRSNQKDFSELSVFVDA